MKKFYEELLSGTSRNRPQNNLSSSTIPSINRSTNNTTTETREAREKEKSKIALNGSKILEEKKK